MSTQITGRVKWFNQFKGYGFLEVEGIAEDVFLHFSVLDKAGIKSLTKNDVIAFIMAKNGERYQVQEIINVISSNKFDINNSKSEKVSAIMKWFNPAKGFGFAQLPTGEDVFIHSNLLKKLAIKNLEPNQNLTLIIHHTNFGYEALDILSYK